MLTPKIRTNEAYITHPHNVSTIAENVKADRVQVGDSGPSGISINARHVVWRGNPESQSLTEDLPVEGFRVLLANADALLARQYQSYLSRLGYEVALAADGLSCTSFLRRCKPDVLVLNTNLLWGRVEGVLAFMQEDGDFLDVSVLVSYDGQYRETLMALQCFNVCDYVANPVNPQQLAACVRSLVPFHFRDLER